MIPLLLRLGGSPSTTQGGFRTPIPGWNAGATTSTTQGGFVTPLPFWNAGASAVEPETPSGGGGGIGQTLSLQKRKKLDRQRRQRLALQQPHKPYEPEVELEYELVTKEIDGTEVTVETPVEPVLSLPSDITPLQDIRDVVEREIAAIMREEIEHLHAVRQFKYVEEMKKLEESVFFMLIALDDEDF